MYSFICPFNLLIHNGIAHFMPEKIPDIFPSIYLFR